MDPLVYEPLSTFEELMAYGDDDKPVEKSASNCDKERGSGACKSKTVPLLDKSFGKGKISVCGKAAGDGGKHPLTLVCHDLKGGYGDDKFVNGTGNMENYVFRHWLLTDIFVYFAHKFVTIPTLGWINAAHSHGVKILGTIITEWDDGAKLCAKFLSSDEAINKTVEKLCKVCDDYGFDGYLLNIENKLTEEEDQVQKMVEFTKKLTEGLKEKSTKNIVIWYDSVTEDGELKWQNCLNQKNKLFFDVCDGIFLNYNWNDEKLASSVEQAGDRKYDVFAGVDCWGRGCWGNGGTNTCLAVDKISKHNLSCAVFAPGWTYENHHFNSFQTIDDELWTKCMPNFHFRYIADQLCLLNGPSKSSNVQVYFATDFSRGYGKKTFSLGKTLAETPWFDLSKQSFQPIVFSSLQCLEYDCAAEQIKLHEIVKLEASKTDEEKKKKEPEKPSSALVCEDVKIYYDTEDGFNGGGSLKILNSKLRKDFEQSMKFSPVWIPLHIPINSNRITLVVILIWKSTSVEHQPHTYLELGKDNSTVSRKLLLGSLDSLAMSVTCKHSIKLRLGEFLECLPGVHLTECDNMEFYFQKNNYDEKPWNGWRVSCYLFDSEQTSPECSVIKSLRIGADSDVSIGFLSLGQIIHSDDA